MSGSFRQAQRKVVPLKVALQGVSFSGKTMSAIKLAHGLAGDKPVCVIDTENESAALYSELDFLHAVIAPPFKPDKFIGLIREAVKAGAGAIVIDTLSHGWQYILEYKEELDKRGGNSYQNWAKAKPLWGTLKDAILQSPVHVVVTMREKAEYVVETADDGKNKKGSIKKLGTKAIAEEGTEYDFTVVWKLDKDTHLARVEKDRTNLFDGRSFLIDESIGQELLKWLGDGDLEVAPEWKLLAESNPDEFESAAEQSEAAMRDKAKSVLRRLAVPDAVSKQLAQLAREADQDAVHLVIDADRYGATTPGALVSYVCAKLGAEPGQLLAVCEAKAANPSVAVQAPPEPELEIIDLTKFKRHYKAESLDDLDLAQKVAASKLEQIDLSNRGLQVIR
jgi:hypothetical protein